MASRNNRTNRPARPQPGQAQASMPQEPVMRRWPHPVTVSAAERESGLHYICCALSYQNQLLADIKALLEQLTTAQTAGE